jgi:hypothetical protein
VCLTRTTCRAESRRESLCRLARLGTLFKSLIHCDKAASRLAQNAVTQSAHEESRKPLELDQMGSTSVGFKAKAVLSVE